MFLLKIRREFKQHTGTLLIQNLRMYAAAITRINWLGSESTLKIFRALQKATEELRLREISCFKNSDNLNRILHYWKTIRDSLQNLRTQTQYSVISIRRFPMQGRSFYK